MSFGCSGVDPVVAFALLGASCKEAIPVMLGSRQARGEGFQRVKTALLEFRNFDSVSCDPRGLVVER